MRTVPGLKLWHEQVGITSKREQCCKGKQKPKKEVIICDYNGRPSPGGISLEGDGGKTGLRDPISTLMRNKRVFKYILQVLFICCVLYPN